jgi:hypothetical protein
MKQQLKNGKLYRNVILLTTILSCIFAVSVIKKDVVSAQGEFLLANYHAHDEKVDYRAYASVAGWCSPGVSPVSVPVYAYAYADERCENGRSVRNIVNIEGAAGEPELIQTARASVIFNGLDIRDIVGFTACSNVFNTVEVLNIYTPSSCWFQDNSPIDLGNIALNYPPDFGGCDYCAANWMTDAACQGPNDHYYCGQIQTINY